MMIRVLTAHVAPNDAGTVAVALRELLEELRREPGMEYAKLARRLVPDGEEIIFFEEWATPADLYRWTGGDLRRPRLGRQVRGLLRNLVITHYEALDRTPEELGLDLLRPLGVRRGRPTAGEVDEGH